LPVTVKQMFRWCRYYFLTNPLINATVFKLSEYPITDIVVDHEDPQVVKRWTDYFHDHLSYRPFQVECGLDYHTYGNCAVSISYPFKKYLVCSGCGEAKEASKIRDKWVFTNFTFRLNCPSCGSVGDAEVNDFYYKNPSGIKLIRWNVEDIEITYNDVTGDATYFYNIPAPTRNDIVIGKKDIVDSIPEVFIQALKQRKGVVFSKSNFFHFKRPTLAHKDRGWGTPLVLPVLKDTFYLQIMKKAQEAILLEHIVPLRILFPQAGSGSSDPYTTINLVTWRDQVGKEIARWRQDNNYIPILPLPVGNQTLGGDGRALMLTQEMQAWSEHIMMGMGVPREFLMGGLSYSGTNVSMRMLENAFLGYILRHKQMAKWIMKEVANYLDWPEVNLRFKPFKMADDIQRKAYLFQLNQAQKVSDTTLLADADLSQEEEDEIMLRETDKRLQSTRKQQLAMAEVQAEAQLIMSKAQVKAQQAAMEAQQAPAAPGEPGGAVGGGGTAGGQEAGGPPPGAMQQLESPLNQGQDMGVAPQQGQPAQAGVDIRQIAQQLAQQYAQLPPDQQQLALQNISAQSPELAQLVRQYASQLGASSGQGQQQGSQMPGIDTRPLPEQRPPRRALSSV
jgi:hypothetical protein